MAQAVTQLFPGAKFAIGPAIEDGFYYDFELPDGRTFTEDDLDRDRGRDARDHEGRPAVRAGRGARRRSARSCSPTSPTSARSSSASHRRPTRTLTRSTPARSAGETISVYRNTPEFVDLCRGPHVPSHRQARPLQADEGGRRLLARQREAADAAAHLRHRLGDARPRSTSTCTGSRRPRSATTASWPPSSTCSASRTSSAAAWPCGTPRAPWCAS